MSEPARRVAHALVLAVFAACVFVVLSGCTCADRYEKCKYDPKCCFVYEACQGELPREREPKDAGP